MRLTFSPPNSDPADPLSKVSARPDFVGVIYPGPTPFIRDPATKIPRIVPPSFIASAGTGDKVHALWATDYFTAMLKAGVPNLETHVYGNGGHGGGHPHILTTSAIQRLVGRDPPRA